MKLDIVGRNLEITEALAKYVEKKIGKLDRYLPTLIEGQVELTKQGAKSAADRHVAQVTLRTDRAILRAEERNADIFAAIDAVLDKTYRQIARYKGKRQHMRGRRQGEPLPVPEYEEEMEGEEEEEGSVIVRRKQFQARPMNEEEAIEQMELLGHDFFAFYNADTNNFNVLYRRKDGDYGLLEPELG